MKLDPSELGTTLVVAPHPDDESLGCGGLIALLADFGQHVHLLVMTDGAGSHPNSPSYPPDRLRKTRYRELQGAANVLGLSPDAMTFLNLPDRYVPDADSLDFSATVLRVCTVLCEIEPATIVVPWQRDYHCDHEASWQVIRAAAGQAGFTGRWLEYQVWGPELGNADAQPRPGEMRTLELDVSDVLDRKRRAIAAHRSQTTDLIDDDPTGFRFTSETLARFDNPTETYLEPNDA